MYKTQNLLYPCGQHRIMMYQKRLPQQRSLVVGAGVLADRPVQGKPDNREQRNVPMIALNIPIRSRAEFQYMGF